MINNKYVIRNFLANISETIQKSNKKVKKVKKFMKKKRITPFFLLNNRYFSYFCPCFK